MKQLKSLVPLFITSTLVLTACGRKQEHIVLPTAPNATPPPALQNGAGLVFKPSDGTASNQGAFLVKVEWLTGPVANAYSSARLSFADAKGNVVKTISDVAFSPWMPSMGHGTSELDQKIAAEPGMLGVYDVQQIDLIMGGDWQLRITATVNGKTDTALVAAKVP